MVNTAEMAESPTAAEQSDTEQSGTGLDALVCGTDVPQGTVVMAATPIGNTADASARLIALLERADIVAAEDTRRLYALANRLGVHVNGRVVATTITTSETSPTACSIRWKPALPCWSCPTRACRPSTIRASRSCVAPSNVVCPSPALPARPQCWTRCAFQDCPPTASAMKDSCRASIPNACNTCVPAF